MPSHYTDTDDVAGPSASRINSRGSTSRSSGPASYTDRFRLDTPYDQPRGLHGEGATSIARLKQLIERACRPSLREPDLGLNLQIADIINEKKGVAPREAANTIVKFINSWNQHVAVLAVAVLDVCVKNCGYPFHLQISRKDFLNELVKRFPEKPPLHYTRIQLLILECIEEWKVTLCATSKHRDDFGYIRDMHRLLSYKGYMFPEISRDDAAVLTAPESETLKSAAELEEEDRAVQEAKLQELIRSGTPADLKEANHLMSIMAGFRDTKLDYRAKVAQEVDKLRRKAEILDEMLANRGPEDSPDELFSELAASLKSAEPKLERIAKEEVDDDPEAASKVETLRQYISGLLTKCDLMAHGDWTGASNVVVSGDSAPVQKQPTSLIDIDDDFNAPAASEGSSAPAGADLLGLSFNGLTLGGDQAPGQSAAYSSAQSTADVVDHSRAASTDLFGDLIGSSESPSAASAPSSTSSATALTVWDDGTIKVDLFVTKVTNGVAVEAVMSNPSDKKITNLRLEVAQPRSLSLEIDPQSGTELLPRQSAGIHQRMRILGSGTAPRLRWRVNYNWGIESRTASGDARDLQA